MMKLITFFLTLAAVQGFSVDGRRGFLSNAVEFATGAAFIAVAPQIAGAEPMSACGSEMGPFEVRSIASCHGEATELTPAEEAYADGLMGKMNIAPNSVVDEATLKGKQRNRAKPVIQNHMDI